MCVSVHPGKLNSLFAFLNMIKTRTSNGLQAILARVGAAVDAG